MAFGDIVHEKNEFEKNLSFLGWVHGIRHIGNTGI